MRIIHITDLHLRNHLPGTSDVSGRESRHMSALLESFVTLCAVQGGDLGVVSGDLVDVPAGASGDARLQELAWRDLLLVDDALRGTGLPWVVLPGNHDLPDDVNRIWGACRDCAVLGHRVISFDDRERPDHVPIRAGVERTRFHHALNGEDDMPQIHVQHYVLHPRLDEGYPHTYEDAEALVAEITRGRRVRLVLSGHYHPGVMPLRIGETWFAVAPALCVAPHPVMVYDLDAEGLSWRCHDLEGAT